MCELYCKYGFKTDDNGCGVWCADPFECTEDADCTLVNADCCGCQAGGKSIAVNKTYAPLMEVEGPCEINGHAIMCPAVYMCMGQPACVNNRCEIMLGQ